MLMTPGFPDRQAPLPERGVSLLAWGRLHYIEDGRVASARRRREMWPGLRPAGKQHVHVLYLTARIVPLAGEIEADQRKRGADWTSVCRDMLRAVGVNRQLVNERALPISPRQGIDGQLAAELPACGRGVLAPVNMALRDWRQMGAASRAVSVERCSQENPHEAMGSREYCASASNTASTCAA